jgi:hypothetical protein
MLQALTSRQALELFLYDSLHHSDLKRLFGYNTLILGYLQLLESLQMRDLHPGILALPLAKRRMADDMLLADVQADLTRFLLALNADNPALYLLALSQIPSSPNVALFYFYMLRFQGKRTI